LDTTGASTAPTPPVERAFFGATLAETNDRVMVRNVREGTPAYDQGIIFDDQIIALDGNRVTLETFDARMSEKRPGDKVAITVFRRDELKTIEVTLGGRIVAPYVILPVANPNDDQQRLYQLWMGAQLVKK
jgi:predicted metalloprotease with PDZ domain